MHKRKNKIARLIMAGVILLPTNTHALQNNLRQSAYKHDIIAGEDRYETGAKVAKELKNYDTIILINGENMVDGLSAASLAGKFNATIIPIKPNEIPESVKPIINNAKKIYIMGGTDSISEKVEDNLSSKEVIRIGGSDRFETSEKVANIIGDYNKAYIVNGIDGIADAISISPVSSRDISPVILTDGENLSYDKIDNVKYTVIGGESMITSSIQKKYDADRISGKDRYDTNRNIISKFYSNKNTRYFTSGETLIDALSASYLSKNDGVVLVSSKHNHDMIIGKNTIQIGGIDFKLSFGDETTTITQKPAEPEVKAILTRKTNEKGEFKVDFEITKESEDNGDTISYEWEGRTENDYYGLGEHTVKVRAVNTKGAKSEYVVIKFNITNEAPTEPKIKINTTRIIKDKKIFVSIDISEESKDPDGDTISYEWEGRTEDDYYGLGEHTVKVRAVDGTGKVSDWVEAQFTLENTAPTVPVITKDPDGSIIQPGTPITITANSTDAENDKITYVWENRPEETYIYPLGRSVVRVKAVDSLGAESKWIGVMFFMADANGNGGLTLTGPESSIIEEGIEGATISKYTFNVPAVNGHNGNDYGLVKGYNPKTKSWEEIERETTNNGVTMSKELEKGKYTKLEFYYYTNHNCMYNKSNITYSVEYDFNTYE